VIWAALALLPGIGASALPAVGAATLLSMSLGDMARGAGVVFAGTVTDVRAAAAPGTIITRVTFRDLAFGKGHVAGDSLILSVNGGTLLGHAVDDDEAPKFRAGQRCIVFSRGDLGSFANHYRSVVGGWQGVFYEEFDSTLMKVSLRQPLSVPVADIRGEGIVVADGKLAFTRMTEKDFLAAVGRIAEHPVPTATDSL
jgi:hypothetical protein